MKSTSDTPKERDDKAEVLESDRIVRAAVLEAELRAFRREVRLYHVFLLVFVGVILVLH